LYTRKRADGADLRAIRVISPGDYQDVNWDGLKAGVRRALEQWRPDATLIENAHHGPPLYQELLREFRVHLVNPVTAQHWSLENVYEATRSGSTLCCITGR
jgi:hypothetical protein